MNTATLMLPERPTVETLPSDANGRGARGGRQTGLKYERWARAHWTALKSLVDIREVSARSLKRPHDAATPPPLTLNETGPRAFLGCRKLAD
ncbi:hypothetical protein NDU88_001093 [Pleurodeles waltl]|uniref:Uncharacterized protein n=1 Tax=Pleurodeles waltl TaxID=8319 RepID=A0AAV7KR53_PLEWA|nr:hypothetical protein NDU88_001093 [Pleurodeles waltl]